MTAFDQAWDLTKALFTREVEWDSLSKQDRLNIAELFAGLGGSPLMEHMGSRGTRGGWGGGARERGHNIQSWDIAEHLKQGDPDYHIRDIRDMNAEEIMEAFDGGWLDMLFASPQCKPFSTGGGQEAMGWKPPDDVEEMSRSLFDEDPGLNIDRARERVFPRLQAKYGSSTRQSPEEAWRHWLWDSRLKHRDFNVRRGTEGGVGYSGFNTRDVDEILFLDDDKGTPRTTTGGKPISEEYAERLRARKLYGLELLQALTKITEDLRAVNADNPRGPMRFAIENPMGQMRYRDEISRYPLTEIDAASYREPANSLLYGLPNPTDAFEMIPGQLPPKKETDIFGVLPEGFVPRPGLPRSMADILYVKSPRGSRTGVQGVRGLPKDALFAGSPAIEDFHVKSVIPAYLGQDILTALERERGIRAPPTGYENLPPASMFYHMTDANRAPLQSNVDRMVQQILSRRT